ncbi:MAG: hypothetical protein NZ703_03760, partial [Gemmataceae bacterium]|nr:hypothetical protein [Gemmataceae bacterium]
MSTTRSPALPAARPVHATFHLRMPVCPRSVRLVPLADQPLDCDSPADSALRTTVAVPEPGKQGPATTTGIPPGPAASLVGTTAPAASATPLSTATSGPAGTTASPPPSPATPPSSREIILPGRRPSAEEERQRQLEREQIQQVVAALRMAAAE